MLRLPNTNLTEVATVYRIASIILQVVESRYRKESLKYLNRKERISNTEIVANVSPGNDQQTVYAS
jgi:hypothetical protein